MRGSPDAPEEPSVEGCPAGGGGQVPAPRGVPDVITSAGGEPQAKGPVINAPRDENHSAGRQRLEETGSAGGPAPQPRAHRTSRMCVRACGSGPCVSVCGAGVCVLRGGVCEGCVVYVQHVCICVWCRGVCVYGHMMCVRGVCEYVGCV